MRHRRKGRVLGRSPSHQRALLRNLASALMLTERVHEADEIGAPKVAGRITTTLAKAKEVRPLVERCVTIARKGLAAQDRAREFSTDAKRDSAEWKKWRLSERWKNWVHASAPAVVARRRVVQLLGDKKAARIVFERIAPRYVDRPGGYTRILKLATPRLGDAGPRAIIEFVGDEARVQRSPAPRVESVEGSGPTLGRKRTGSSPSGT
ncbi:MAG: L17 family ribosomal protein [Planctomycetota bacterium]|nr:MAG: 50S ribosomal protein L17 [Planctomycetaceae bacterium]